MKSFLFSSDIAARTEVAKENIENTSRRKAAILLRSIRASTFFIESVAFDFSKYMQQFINLSTDHGQFREQTKSRFFRALGCKVGFPPVT